MIPLKGYDIARICREYLKGKSGLKIEKELGLPTGMAYHCLKKGGVKARPYTEMGKKYTANYDYFETIDTVNKAQVLGFIAADGGLSHTKEGQKNFKITLHEKDTDYLEYIKKEIEYTGPILRVTKNKPYMNLGVVSPKMFDDLVSHNVTLRKSLTLEPPKGLPKYLYAPFIRGYFEGDGCIHLSTKKVTNAQFNIVGTPAVLNWMGEFFTKKGHVTYRVRAIKNNRAFVLTVSGNQQIMKVLDLLYKDGGFVMGRKHKKYLFLKALYDERGKPKITKFKDRKVFYIKSPSGQIWHTKNMSAFSRDNGLHFSMVSDTLAGKIKHCRHWVLPTQEEINHATASGLLVTKFYPDL